MPEAIWQRVSAWDFFPGKPDQIDIGRVQNLYPYRRVRERDRSPLLPDLRRVGLFPPAARPSIVGIHGGCFADPDFPAPNTAGWNKHKHDWVVIPDGTEGFDENPQ